MIELADLALHRSTFSAPRPSRDDVFRSTEAVAKPDIMEVANAFFQETYAQAFQGIVSGQTFEAVIRSYAQAFRPHLELASRGFLCLAAVYLLDRDYDSSLRLVQEGIKNFQDDLALRAFHGEILLAAERFDEARPLLTALYKKHPHNSSITLALARVYLGLGELDHGRALLEKSIRLDTNNMVAYTLLARSFIDEGRPKEGIRLLNRALRASPREATILVLKAWALIAAGKERDAIRALDTALEIDPHDPNTWLVMSRAHEQAGDYQQAEQACRNAIAYGHRKWMRDFAKSTLERMLTKRRALETQLRVVPVNPSIARDLAGAFKAGGDALEDERSLYE